MLIVFGSSIFVANIQFSGFVHQLDYALPYV